MTKRKDSAVGGQPRLRDALETVRPQLVKLPDSKLRTINLDPLAAVALTRGALPGLMAIRSSLAASVSSFDVSTLDLLETYGMALVQADTIFKGITARSQSLGVVSSEAYELRARLLGDATVLVQRGHIAAPRLSRLRGPNGHRNIAADLLTLTGLLRDSWPIIANKTAILTSELDRAEVLGDELIKAIGMRDQLTAVAAEAALQRQRAFTLFIGAYDEVRQAVVYVRRHEGDAERIAPSLYGKRKARRKKAELSVSSSVPAAPGRVEQPEFDPFLH